MLNKLFLFVCFCGLVCAQNSPVFIWGSSSAPFKPALKSLSADDFGEIISTNLEDSMLLVFLEKNLQTSDFSQCKLKSGETCFSNLKTFPSKTFYADVVDPVNTVKSLTESEVEIVELTKDGKLSNIKYQAGKILIIPLKGIKKERSETLIEHDLIMAEIYKSLADDGKIFAIYTSEENTQQSLNRIRRQANAGTVKNFSFSGKDDDMGILFYIASVTLNRKENINVTAMSVKKGEKTNIDVTLKTDKGDIKFIVLSSKGYWSVNEISLGDVKFPADVEAAVGFSYFCGNLTVFASPDTMTFHNLQLQAYYKIKEDPKKFGDPWHCVGFISGGIISGLFVSLMFIIIMSIGITWIMDIRTMDRFDDPKGKTITINVTD